MEECSQGIKENSQQLYKAGQTKMGLTTTDTSSRQLHIKPLFQTEQESLFFNIAFYLSFIYVTIY